MNLVFFDIDGTLANGTVIPDSAKKALRKLRENGDLIWICTGRPIHYVKKNFYQYANGYICSNGREAYTCCEKIFDRPLSMAERKTITDKLDAVGAGYTFMVGKQGYYFGPQEGYDYITSHMHSEFYMNQDLGDKKVYNFDVWFKDRDHFKQIQEALDGLAILNPHGPILTADATVIGVDKGTAISYVAQYMKVPVEHTYAFGDGINDLLMFPAVGHTIAMGNGQQALKEQAEFVTTDINEDGVYNGLKHFNLI